MADLPFELPGPLAQRLRAAADVEGKIPRALEALGPLAGRRVGVVGDPGAPEGSRLTIPGVEPIRVPATEPLRIDLPDASLDALVSLWSAFHGVDGPAIAEADRVLVPGGRLLVVHDYGRDEVSALADADAPQYRSWSRREGPFLRGGFKVRVLHCFWTFDSIEEARAFLEEAFGERGVAAGAGLKRPRLSWNVAVYHRWQAGAEPPASVAPGAAVPA